MTVRKSTWALGLPLLTLLVTGLSLANVVPVVTGLGLLLLLTICIALAVMPSSPRSVSRRAALLAALAVSASCGLLVLGGLLTNLVARLNHTSWVVTTSASALILQALALRRWPGTAPLPRRPTATPKALLPLALGVILPMLILALALTGSLFSAHSLERKEAVISASVTPMRADSALVQVSCFPCATQSVAVVVSTSRRSQRAIAHLSTNATTWSRAVPMRSGAGVTVTIRGLHSPRALASARLSPTRLQAGTIASGRHRLKNATN